jgi:hypothetical protein
MAQAINEGGNSAATVVKEQAKAQTGQRQMQLLINEEKMETSYANAFRTNGTAEEVMIDFGMNTVARAAQPSGPAQILFQLTDRIVLNYFSPKRLAITLTQMIRRHEQQFGELELDVAKRQKTQ